MRTDEKEEGLVKCMWSLLEMIFWRRSVCEVLWRTNAALLFLGLWFMSVWSSVLFLRLQLCLQFRTFKALNIALKNILFHVTHLIEIKCCFCDLRICTLLKLFNIYFSLAASWWLRRRSFRRMALFPFFNTVRLLWHNWHIKSNI